MSTNKSNLTTAEDVQKCVTLLFGMKQDIVKLQREYDIMFEHLQSMVGYLPRSDHNDLPLCSSLFHDWYFSNSTPLKRPQENNDNDEEVYVTSKKSKIETEHFPPPFPSSSSSSSSSTKTVRKYTSIQKDVGPQGRKRWSLMCKIPGITDTKKQNWGRGWCTEQHIVSDILRNNPSFDKDEYKRIDNEIEKLRQAENNTVPLPPPPPPSFSSSSSSSSSLTPISRRSSFSPSNSPHQTSNPFLIVYSSSSSSFDSSLISSVDSSSSSSYNPFVTSKLTSAVSTSSSSSSDLNSSGSSFASLNNIYSNLNQ
jgi:hypothetical protein